MASGQIPAPTKPVSAAASAEVDVARRRESAEGIAALERHPKVTAKY